MTTFDMEDHSRRALEQSAMHATRLAIVRWTRGERFPQMQVDAALRGSAQERWYSIAQRNFREWLEHGGFSQAEECDIAPQLPLSGSDCFQERIGPIASPYEADDGAEYRVACLG